MSRLLHDTRAHSHRTPFVAISVQTAKATEAGARWNGFRQMSAERRRVRLLKQQAKTKVGGKLIRRYLPTLYSGRHGQKPI